MRQRLRGRASQPLLPHAGAAGTSRAGEKEPARGRQPTMATDDDCLSCVSPTGLCHLQRCLAQRPSNNTAARRAARPPFLCRAARRTAHRRRG
eukprot:scaffold366_cov305-Prasinococcus_capsulatus_cf.AAC.1